MTITENIRAIVERAERERLEKLREMYFDPQAGPALPRRLRRYDLARPSSPIRHGLSTAAARASAGRIGYPLMSVRKIAALPVGELAAEDAHLWLWATGNFLAHGILRAQVGLSICQLPAVGEGDGQL